MIIGEIVVFIIFIISIITIIISLLFLYLYHISPTVKEIYFTTFAILFLFGFVVCVITVPIIFQIFGILEMIESWWGTEI